MEVRLLCSWRRAQLRDRGMVQEVQGTGTPEGKHEYFPLDPNKKKMTGVQSSRCAFCCCDVWRCWSALTHSWKSVQELVARGWETARRMRIV